VVADRNGFSAVVFGSRFELDPAVTVPIVLPANKCRYPGTDLLDALEWPAWVDGLVLHGTEQPPRVGVVITVPRSG
jgi:hypothetical protein